MRGMFVIARYGILELTRGRMFWIILLLALGVNFVTSYGWYYAATKSAAADTIQDSFINGDSFEGPFSEEGFDPAKINYPLLVIKNTLRWLSYVVYIFFGNFLAIFGAVGLIGPELDKRSIYTLISKPISRTHIYLGKLFGLFGSLLLYAVIMNITSQMLFIISGAGYQPSLFIASAIGFMNFIIFGLFALLLSTRLNSILAAVLSVILLWSSTNFSVTMMKQIGTDLFKFGDWLDYFILLLPSQKSIGNYAIHFILDKYYGSMLHEIQQEVFEFITDKPIVLVQPLIWIAAVLILGYLSFFRKEFD